MAERCTVLCESNMRALLKDLCVSLPPVLFKNRKPTERCVTYILGMGSRVLK